MICLKCDGVENSFGGKEKNPEMKQIETRFQFGGFVPMKEEDQVMNEYPMIEEFETFDMPVEGESVKKSRRELKEMEYKSLERQRRIQHEKFNDRRKAAMKRKN